MTTITMIDKNSAIEFFDSLSDDDLSKLVQRSVSETMYSIEMCYNFYYREFLKKNGYTKSEWKNATIFDNLRANEFSAYLSKRLNIKVREIHYFEFAI